MSIDNKGEYLGVWLGPGGWGKMWEKVDKKYVKTCETIASSGVAFGLACPAYNFKGASLYS
eukprot:2415871-Karenia_brevis.AAC.1